jgi:hypothetical protein
MFENHITKDRRDGEVFTQLLDPVGSPRGRAENFEDNDDPRNNAVDPWSLGTGNESVGIADGIADGGDTCIRT